MEAVKVYVFVKDHACAWFFVLLCADHLANEFDQIRSIAAFKDVHSNTGIFGIHTSTVSTDFIHWRG